MCTLSKQSIRKILFILATAFLTCGTVSAQVILPLCAQRQQKAHLRQGAGMTHAYSNAIMDKVEEAVKNGIVGNEDDDW